VCYALFIGTDHPLCVADLATVDERFHLEELQPGHSVVLPLFSKPNVLYAASWQDCGCGWFPNTIFFQRRKSRAESNRKTSRDIAELGDLLAGLLDRSDSVELYLGWESELSETPVQRIELSPADFQGDALPMRQGDFAVVARARPI